MQFCKVFRWTFRQRSDRFWLDWIDFCINYLITYSIQLAWFFWPPDECQSNVHSPLSFGLCFANSWGKYLTKRWQNQNSKAVGRKTKTTSLKMLKCFVELRGTPEWGDNSLWVCYYEWPFECYSIVNEHINQCNFKLGERDYLLMKFKCS